MDDSEALQASFEKTRARYRRYVEVPSSVWLNGEAAPFEHFAEQYVRPAEHRILRAARIELNRNEPGCAVHMIRALCLSSPWESRERFKQSKRKALRTGGLLPQWCIALPVFAGRRGRLLETDLDHLIPWGRCLGAAHHPVFNDIAQQIYIMDRPWLADAGRGILEGVAI